MLENPPSESFFRDIFLVFICVFLFVYTSWINFTNFTMCFPSFIKLLKLKYCFSIWGACEFSLIKRNIFSSLINESYSGSLSLKNLFVKDLLNTSQVTLVVSNIQYKVFCVKLVCFRYLSEIWLFYVFPVQLVFWITHNSCHWVYKHYCSFQSIYSRLSDFSLSPVCS